MKKSKAIRKILSIALSLAMFASCLPVYNVHAQEIEPQGDFTTCEHDYERQTIQEATCQNQGKVLLTCKKCGDIDIEYTDTIDHDYSVEQIIKYPTCEEDGIKHMKCATCDDYEEETIDAIGHHYVASTAKNPTCTENGSTKYICTNCGDKYEEDDIPTIAHDYKKTTTSATCEEDGTVTYTCSMCGDSYEEEIKATGHDYVSECTQLATCEENGVITYTCKKCGDSYDDDSIPALGHSYTVETVRNATETSEGLLRYTCTRCSDSYEETIPALGNEDTDDGKKDDSEDDSDQKFEYVNDGNWNIVPIDLYNAINEKTNVRSYESADETSSYITLDGNYTVNVELNGSVAYITGFGISEKCNKTDIVLPETLTCYYTYIDDSKEPKTDSQGNLIKCTTKVTVPSDELISTDKEISVSYDGYYPVMKQTKLGLKSIENAFSQGSYVSNKDFTLTVPDCVEYLEDSAFQGNIYLKAFTGNVKKVGDSAFANCTSVQRITIGEILQGLGDSAFENCTSLKSVYIKDGNAINTITSIPYNCFYNCASLTSFNIPSYITAIEDNAFASTLVSGIKFENLNVRRISDKAFANTKLTSVNLPKCIENVSASAFDNISTLKYVYVPNESAIEDKESTTYITGDITPKITVKNFSRALNNKTLYNAKRNMFVHSIIDVSNVVITRNGAQALNPVKSDRNIYGHNASSYTFINQQGNYGTYTVTAYTPYGSYSQATFSYYRDVNDTTAPSINIEGKGSNNIYSTAKITASDSQTAVEEITVNGEIKAQGFTAGSEGTYKITAEDSCGNIASRTITIDKTSPTIDGVKNGGCYTKMVTISFADNIGVASAMLNGKNIQNGYEVVTNGNYELVVTDFAGNKKTVKFGYDNAQPRIKGVKANQYYKGSATISFESYVGIKSAKVKKDNGSYLSVRTSGYTANKDGKYSVKIVDGKDRESTITFYVDGTLPKIKGIKNGGMYQKAVSYTVSDKNISKVTVNGKSQTKNGKPVTKGKIEKKGTYTITAYDKAGNKTSCKITYTTNPIITGVVKNGYYKKISCKFYDGDGIKDSKVTYNDGKKNKTLKSTKKSFKAGSEGKYTIKATDKKGNSTSITCYIDKTIPTVKIGNKSYSTASSKVTVSSGTKITFDDKKSKGVKSGISSATLNGKAFTSGSSLDTAGSYTLVVKDKAGNTNKVSITVTK